MKTLSLYIDRWYIAAAVSSDNIPRRIELPNREDRIWLYFYEDINNIIDNEFVDINRKGKWLIFNLNNYNLISNICQFICK